MDNNTPVNPTGDIQLQQSLLRMEYEYEKEEFMQRSEKTDIDRKVRRGICWYPITTGRNYYNSLNQLVVEIKRNEEEATEHAFEPGRTVCFFCQTTDGQVRYINFTAGVSYVSDNLMVVALPDPAALQTFNSGDAFGVQLYFDETTYKTMFEALADVLHAKDNRLAELRDILLSGTPLFRPLVRPVHFPWLNAAQEKAIDKVSCALDVAIVHGPPGTGKTTTLVEAIYKTLHHESQVLVCAQSNAAVDCISEKLIDRGVSMLRIGNPMRVNDKMLSFTYEHRFESHPDYPEIWNVRKAIREMSATLHLASKSLRGRLHGQIRQLRKRAFELEWKINTDIFDNARVIASTLVGSNNKVLNGRHFTTLFIDEAAQALEAACWIAIRKADRVIFAGDHCQLPPTIKCFEAAQSGLKYTLMEKIIKRNRQTASILKVQYRMHEDIMRFSSEWFYHGELEAAPEVRNRTIFDSDAPITWIDTSGMDFNEETVGEFGRINRPEANLLLEQLELYMLQIGKQRIEYEQIDFGLISPYKAQVQYLRSLIKGNGAFKSIRSLISVNTVDGFQGQERDVIFISLVRANEKGDIGFLNDLRRMNVAITRARMKLVILGDAGTLTKHAFYRKLMEFIEDSE
ncbi:MAG: AAA family ATPase [Prevotellaceae bacterium]|jgi:superfamily I DNA and/or RNA helicase|nr:AAA family ATPase [Prevotellaceae bacterium]